MQRTSVVVTRSAKEWREGFPRSGECAVVAVGNFDGVHLGHQKILQTVKDRAGAIGAGSLTPELRPVSAVLTFYPHPARVVRPGAAPPLLMTIDQRLAAFAQAQMDAALVLPFDHELAELAPEEFVRQYVVETMRAKAVLVGANFRFGHKQGGDVNLLRTLGEGLGFATEVIAPVVIDGMVVSSTAVREALREGRVDDARKLLGRPYALAGEIRTGSGLGTKLVVPTLNLATEQELLPKLGVYATEVVLDAKVYQAATNVGIRPTFDGANTTVESHLLDFNEARSGGSMEVRFLRRLRDEQKFPSAQALREQIMRDIGRAREYFEVANQ